MIEKLRIAQLALVEKLQLEFAPGLNVITGETGAGKSIVLGALALLTGARAQTGAVREGAEAAEVEAVFETGALPELEEELKERGLEGDQHELIVRRAVAKNGRSRAWISGQQTPVSQLGALFGGRVEVSSQHASQALLQPGAQARLLDAAGALDAAREKLAQAVRQLRECTAEIARLQKAAEERARREDILNFQINEIDEAELTPKSFEEQSALHARLVHAEKLQSGAQRAALLLQGDAAAAAASRGAAEQTGAAAREIAELAALDSQLKAPAERLNSARLELDDLGAELERYASGCAADADPARLARVEEGIRVFEKLRGKYGKSVEEILAFRESAAAERAALAGSETRLKELAGEQKALLARAQKLAAQLTKGRQKAAAKLQAQALTALRELALPQAVFKIALEPLPPPEGLPCGPAGAEAALFLFSANPGESPQPLHKVASGGELSRVFLALKNVLRRGERGMVLVFDEVDAGIGGAVAERIGITLAKLAREHQVLCITHLPQIAAQGAHHFCVRKTQAQGRTHTGVQKLTEAERVDEIARMAGGARITSATRKHARALLSAAKGGE